MRSSCTALRTSGVHFTHPWTSKQIQHRTTRPRKDLEASGRQLPPAASAHGAAHRGLVALADRDLHEAPRLISEQAFQQEGIPACTHKVRKASSFGLGSRWLLCATRQEPCCSGQQDTNDVQVCQSALRSGSCSELQERRRSGCKKRNF